MSTIDIYKDGAPTLNSFAEVEARYNKVKPMRDGRRPIGRRRRKWEHICKFSDDCYGLLDGGLGDKWRSSPYLEMEKTAGGGVTTAEAKALAPILWTRDRFGVERIHIRNESGTGAHMSRYAFLQREMPRGLFFHNSSNGHQFIACVHNGTSYYLAKSKMVPQCLIEPPRLRRWWTDSKYDVTSSDDNVSLVFARNRVTGDWEFEPRGKDIPRPPRIKVDKKSKVKFKKEIDEFWDWLCVTAPMLPVNDWSYISEKRGELDRAAVDVWDKTTAKYSASEILALQVIKDYNHPLRINMAVDFLTRNRGDMLRVTTVEEAKKVRASYNRWINKTLGFNKTC